MMRFRLCSELGPAGYQDILGRKYHQPTAAQGDREARYCEYRSQWTFPSSSPTLAIWSNDASYTGQAVAYALARRLGSEGFIVEVEVPAEPEADWNDVHRLRRSGSETLALHDAPVLLGGWGSTNSAAQDQHGSAFVAGRTHASRTVSGA